METKRQRQNEFHILALRELSRLLILVTLLPKDDNQCDAQEITSLNNSSLLNGPGEGIEEIVVYSHLSTM